MYLQYDQPFSKAMTFEEKTKSRLREFEALGRILFLLTFGNSVFSIIVFLILMPLYAPDPLYVALGFGAYGTLDTFYGLALSYQLSRLYKAVKITAYSKIPSEQSIKPKDDIIQRALSR